MVASAGSPEPVAGHDDAGWLRPAAFAVLLAALVFAAFPQVILGLQTFVYRDFGYFGYPLAHHFRESFWRGEIPLWNPLNNCGLPFLAQWNTQVLYPPALFYQLFPLSWSLGVFCLAHLYLGGLGMYFLAHRWTGNLLAAGIAGVAFALNGLMLNCLMWPNNIAALGWMPWVVWLVERGWREGGRTILVAAGVGALQMLAGAPEIILLTWGLLTVLALSECGIRNVERGTKNAAWLLARFALVAVLVAALSAAQLLPFLDLLAHSHRSADYGDAAWSMPLGGWANFLVPLFHCHPSFHGVFLQTGQCWTASYYIGVPIAALALLAVWQVRERRVRVLGTLAVVCLVLALGDAGHVYRWLREHVPAMGLMRFPIKFVVLPVFLLPLLAAYAVARFERGDSWSRRTFGGIWTLVVALVLAILWFAWRYPLPDDRWAETWHNAVWRAALFTLVLVLLFSLRAVARLKLRRVLQGALILLVWLDLLTHAPRQQTVSRQIYEPNVLRPEPVPRHGTSQAMVSPAAAAVLERSYIPDPAEDYKSRRWTLLWNCNLLDEIPIVDGFFSLYLPGQVQAGALLYASTNHLPSGLLDFLGVSIITSPTNIFDWTRRTTFLPLVTAGQKPVFAEPRPTLGKLASPDFDPQREVFLPPAAKPFVSATNTTRAQIVSSNFTAHRIELEIQADAPAMVVAAQAYYHPWQAHVDGHPVRLWQANYAFQALEVPAGRHRVELAYHDKLFLLGTITSLATMLGGAVTWFKLRSRSFGLG
jgi:hypothetical protein